MRNCLIIASIVFFLLNNANAQNKPDLTFTLSVKDTAQKLYHVKLWHEGGRKDVTEFKLPVWTPGYYQIMNYPDNVSGFEAIDVTNKPLKWEKTNANTWKVYTNKVHGFTISYNVKANRRFVAGNYLDKEMGYVSPAGVFMHPAGLVTIPASLIVEAPASWAVATGLDSVTGNKHNYRAENFDVLYDSPILMGSLEYFPQFNVRNIPHRFIAYKPGEMDREKFMGDMKKIVTVASDIIGDIPYNQYSFLAIGPGGGGIEHLNSASISFSGNGLNTKEGMIRIYNFLAHEYFHHYNVKRIRPIELGPFDYDNGSKTKMLWLSEGLTVYYEYIVVKRAGFMTTDEFLKTFQSSIKEYENKPGRYFQTPADASYNTWADGPFGRTSDEVNKTISPYDKGPGLGLLLDFKIRHQTQNKKSLDDLMRLLYNKYYKDKKRGFTEDEFKQEAEKMAGTSLKDFFDYIYTLKQVDYPTYLGYAGLAIDTSLHELPASWIGVSVRDRNDSLQINSVEWQSPAWEAGLRGRRTILSVNGTKMNASSFNALLSSSKPGDKIKIVFTTAAGQKEEEVTVSRKKEKTFTITRIENPDALQSSILKSWLGE